jgi:hypothetical protein
MVYLLALIFPLAFLYSPKIETSGAVFIVKPMTISQERKSPAYDVFRQSQKVLNSAEISTSQEIAGTNLVLNSDNIVKEKAILKTAELVIDQKELLIETEKKLEQLALVKTDSALLSKLNSTSNVSSPIQPLQPQFSQNQSQAAKIRGNFELIDGVGIVDHIVSLRRVFEGQSFELGEVDLKAGMYQILVGSFEGELVAEIKDRAGMIIGEDRQKILGLKRAGSFFSGPLLKVGQPSAIGFNARNVDERKIAEQNLSASLYSGNFSLKKTTDTYPNVASLSSTLGLIKDRTGKNATTLSFRTAKDNSETLLFSQKWVDGLKNYLSEKLQIQYVPSSGLIIGRIMQDGKPVAGAQVIVENQAGIEPYYLDQFLIPQTNQAVTGANGFFVIPGLNQGRYQISGFIKDRHIGSQLYFVEENIISYQEILTIVKTQSVIVRAFDAFTGQEQDADLTLPGHEDIFTVVDGMARYRTASAEGLQEISVRPTSNQYAPFIYLQNSKKDHMHLPFIQDGFLDQIRIQKQIPITDETAVFIGFAAAGNFDLHLTAENFDRKQIVYFNEKGMVTPTPVAGGGFIIYNLPMGLQEIILQDQKTDRTFSQVIYAEPSRNYITHFSE